MAIAVILHALDVETENVAIEHLRPGDVRHVVADGAELGLAEHFSLLMVGRTLACCRGGQICEPADRKKMPIGIVASEDRRPPVANGGQKRLPDAAEFQRAGKAGHAGNFAAGKGMPAPANFGKALAERGPREALEPDDLMSCVAGTARRAVVRSDGGRDATKRRGKPVGSGCPASRSDQCASRWRLRTAERASKAARFLRAPCSQRRLSGQEEIVAASLDGGEKNGLQQILRLVGAPRHAARLPQQFHIWMRQQLRPFRSTRDDNKKSPAG